MIDRICDYDEAYSKDDAAEIGFCASCSNKSCYKNPNHKTGKDFVKAMIAEYEKYCNEKR